MRKLLATAWITLGLVTWSGVAAAHAHLDHSAPVADAVLDSAPKVVQLWFSRALEPAFSKIDVVNSTGKTVVTGKPMINDNDPKLISIDLQPLSSGKYKVKYRVTALDGHKAAGSFSFTVK